jgi:pimeloyl-ACP methyl ester carboxylesterase
MNGKRRAAVSAGEIAYVDEGEGAAVVLLHGFPLSSHAWRAFTPLLAARFRVIAPDLLGSGDSDKPDGPPLHIRAQAGYVRELLAGLGIGRFAVIAASHGGGVAQLLALDGEGVEAMVLLNPICFDLWPSEQLRDVQRNEPAVAYTESLVRALVTTALDLGMGHREKLGEADVEEFLRPWLGPDGVAAFFRAAAAIDGIGLTGREDDLARLEIPVLILWGEEDPFLPIGAADRLNEAIPTSTLGLLPGCGHFLAEDAPETVAPMVYEYLRARYLMEPHGHEGGIARIQLERRPPGIDEDEEEDA